ncbi:MAG: hypothetical protein JSS86_24705 [Cyanobacteria bacterium SZAS LIN-2]|nr:hypothetical protein [Cyanobacteria bacterium SZAS LIN-2]
MTRPLKIRALSLAMALAGLASGLVWRPAEAKGDQLRRAELRDCSSDRAMKLLRGLLNQDKDGHFSFKRPLRDAFYADPKEEGYSGRVDLESATTLKLKCSGKQRLGLLATFKALDDKTTIGDELLLLAVFKNAGGKEQLIDAVNVQTDRFASLYMPPLLPYKDDSDALIISNTHSNAGESYEALYPVALQGNRLVALCPNFGEFYSGRSATKSLQEQAKYSLGKSNGPGPRPLYFVNTVTVQTMDPDDSDKVLSSKRKVFRIPLRYKNGRYFVDKHDKTMRAFTAFEKSTGLGLDN